MSLVIVWPNAAAAAITVLRDELPTRTEPYAQGSTVVAHVPDERVITSGDPLVMCRPDGSIVEQRVDQRALVRGTAWHSTEFEAMALAGLCQGLLVAASSSEIHSVEHVSGPVPGVDPDNNQPLATFVVACHMRAEAA